MTTAVVNTKIGEVENKTPDTSGLATTAVLNKKFSEAENKISDFSKLVKKLDYNAKVTDIETNYFTNYDCNKFMNDILNVKKKQKEIFSKSNISNLVKNSELNTKLVTLKQIKIK